MQDDDGWGKGRARTDDEGGEGTSAHGEVQGEVGAHGAAVEEGVEGWDEDEPGLLESQSSPLGNPSRCGRAHLAVQEVIFQSDQFLFPGDALLHWDSGAISSQNFARGSE